MYGTGWRYYLEERSLAASGCLRKKLELTEQLNDTKHDWSHKVTHRSMGQIMTRPSAQW